MNKKEKELEADFVDRLVKERFLTDEITPATYHIWERAYKTSLKVKKNNSNSYNYFNQDNALFLFGYNKRLKADTNQGYEDWKRFLDFRKSNTYFDSYYRLFHASDAKEIVSVDELILRRCANIVLKHIESTNNYQKYFPWKLYGILLFNQSSDVSKEAIHAVKSLKLKPSRFRRKLNVLEKIVEIKLLGNYKELGDSFWKIEYDLSKEAETNQLKSIELSDFEKGLSLKPHALNWELCLRFTTTNYFSEYNRNEETIPVNEDAVLELHLFPKKNRVIDLQWYSVEEDDHRIKYPSHKRKRVMWRNMYKHPISHDQILKESCPDFEKMEDFPILVELLASSFGLDFGRKAELITKGVEVDIDVIKNWLSSYVNYVIDKNNRYLSESPDSSNFMNKITNFFRKK